MHSHVALCTRGTGEGDDASDASNNSSSDDDGAADDAPPDCVGGALYATVRGINPDGMRVQAAAEAISSMLWERDGTAERRAKAGRPTSHHVNFADGCTTLQQNVWREVEDKLQCPSNLSRVSWSQAQADGVVRARPKGGIGHGARAERKTVCWHAFIDYLLDGRDKDNFAAIRDKVAQREQQANHVRHLLEVKRRACATYKMIDEYRHLLLVKHASRGQMCTEQRKLVAFIGANLVCAGPKWAADDAEAEALREAAAAMIAAEMDAHAAGKAALQAYRDFTRSNFRSFLSEGRSPGEAMKSVARAWKTAAENPKCRGDAPRLLTRSAAWRAAAATAAATAAAEAAAEAAGGEGAPSPLCEGWGPRQWYIR